ncbi:MAG: DNA polymerase III subunit beta [Clostridiales bacterium]|nr:DNA polymerase III subunit beta [Clostridiales bacterium]
MKFRCDGLELSEAIGVVSKAISSKTTSQILEGIKMSCVDDKLVLSATDLEISIEKTIRAEVETEGETVVPGRLFGEYIKKLTNEQIECELNEKNQLKIAYTDSEGVLQCMEINEFPKLKEIDKDNFFEISKEDFKSLINSVFYAVAQDDSRPILKGVLLEIAENSIRAVAVDGCRLSIANKKLVSSTKDFNLIIPGRNIYDIIKMMDNEGNVKVYVHSNNIMVDLGDTIVINRLIDGQFINYKQIVPKEFSTVVTINKEQLEDAIDRASVLSRVDKNNLVKFDIREKNLMLTSNSELGNTKENITVGLKGNDLNISFNSKYFTDCLKVVDNQYVKMSFNSSILPCVISPCEGDDFLFLILPVRAR